MIHPEIEDEPICQEMEYLPSGCVDCPEIRYKERVCRQFTSPVQQPSLAAITKTNEKLDR